MPKGKVKSYSRGYGNIIDSETGQIIIVYANSITLKNSEIFQAGQNVEYDIENKYHERWAVNVKIIDV